MTKFFNKFKKIYFWHTFPILGQKFIFILYFYLFLALSGITSYGFLAPCQNLEKAPDPIPRKRPDRRTDGKMDGQTLFYRTFPVTAEGPIPAKVLMKLMENV